MSDPAEQAREGYEYIERTYKRAPAADGIDYEAPWYGNGGYILGGTGLVMIHPDECIATREGKCVRHKHHEEPSAG